MMTLERKKYFELQDKCNGLHSGTKFHEIYIGGNDCRKIEYHEHPDTGELVEIESRAVLSGEDDIDYEFEVLTVQSPIICKIFKAINDCRERILNI